MPGTDRRNSSSSEDACSLPPSRQMSQDGSEVIPTRMSKVSAPKPASNPLQFIKVGPCDLYKAAQEQIKKVEEIKKVEKVKDDSEDWQSNLDNWKCSRRKRQEHIIERVVEVKKLELEEHDRNRRRSKTFNEMMEERTSKGGLRKMSLMAYPDDDEANDLSDLGLGGSAKEEEDEEDLNNSISNGLDNGKYHEGNGNHKINGSNGHQNASEYESSTSPEPEEYTYERAIQGYMNFAEAKVKTPIKNINEKKNGTRKKEPGSKIGKKLSEFEQIRRRSESSIEVPDKQLPKVDINKRRSMFENYETTDIEPKSVERVAVELSSTKSIKERLETLEKTNETPSKPRAASEVSTTVKERLNDLEKQSSERRQSNGDVSPWGPTRERQNGQEEMRTSSTDVSLNVSIKERVSHLDSACQKDITTKVTPDRDTTFREKLETFKSTEKSQRDTVNNRNCSESSDKKDFHRSLDGLDKKNTENKQNSFERVQSAEDLEAKNSEPVVFVSQSTIKIKEVPSATAEEEGEETEDDLEEEALEHQECLYTDENIDEVLSHVDEDDQPEETTLGDEMVTRFDDALDSTQNGSRFDSKLDSTHLESGVEASSPESVDLGSAAVFPPNYENVVVSNQVGLPYLSGDGLSFPLGSNPGEPPKEKPPPPPLELSDEETTPELPPKPSLRRLDSTKRIKKEIRKKRSDFLGIDGSTDDSYLESEVYVSPPPDMLTFLQEERRLEQQLYRQSICSESDSNHETAESRDSGVELDRGHVDDMCWSKQPLSEPHSRQNSETFGNTSITSEEDEIMKKEREIIEVLEKEERWRYGSKSTCTEQDHDIGEKLAVKLRQLEQEKMQLEWERAEEEVARREDEERLKAKEKQLRAQETSSNSNKDSSMLSQEALRSDRERLAREQQELERCRQTLLQKQHRSSDNLDLHRGHEPHWDTPSTRHSLQEAPMGALGPPRQDMCSSYRFSLPDLQQRPAAPAPPAPKLHRPLAQEQWTGRVPSVDNISILEPATAPKLRHGSSVPHINHGNHGTQQMTRTTLHALSAAPRSRLITNENWIQPKRKPDTPKGNYNYQHWLIQEAEHRRILEQQQRVSHPSHPVARRPVPTHTHSASAPSHHTVGLPPSPQPHKWMTPQRQDKPLPDSVIQTLTQRVQNRTSAVETKGQSRKRLDLKVPLGGGHESYSQPSPTLPPLPALPPLPHGGDAQDSQERMLSVSGKKKCSHCDQELGRGAAMIIESLRLFYHIDCFKCCVCHVQLGDGLIGTDVRVRNNKLHCHNCYSSDDGVKFSCV